MEQLPHLMISGKEVIKKSITELLIVLLSVICFVQFIAQPVLVRGSSMKPTYLNGDFLMMEKVSYIFSKPKRGDIVVCRYPIKNDNNFRIKRIIGLPGDTVKTANGKVYINGEELKEEYISDSIKTYGLKDGTTVPDGCYLVMGDNRENSCDSRDSDVGAIPRSYIKGRVFFKIVSLGGLLG